MNTLHPLRAWLVACACLCAAAFPAAAAAETALARVTAIYVELAPGLVAERRGTSAEADKPLVAEVHIPAHDDIPARSALVRIDDLDVAIDDTVEVRLGERGRLTGVRPAPAAIVRIEAHGQNQMAQQAPLLLIPQAPAPRRSEPLSAITSLFQAALKLTLSYDLRSN